MQKNRDKEVRAGSVGDNRRSAGRAALTCHDAGTAGDAAAERCGAGGRGPAATLADTRHGPPAERSQTKKSIGRQPPPALTDSRAGRRAVARRRAAIPHKKPVVASTPDLLLIPIRHFETGTMKYLLFNVSTGENFVRERRDTRREILRILDAMPL
ncbi:unnamed protein product [Colias eurytheme]|nr:unnamed protein product [Colias eurytheme]